MFNNMCILVEDKNTGSKRQQMLRRERAGQELHEQQVLQAVERTIEQFARNDFKAYQLHDADKAYYHRRAVLYQQLTDKLTDLYSVRDYSEINCIVQKRQAIRQDIRELMVKNSNFSKKLQS